MSEETGATQGENSETQQEKRRSGKKKNLRGREVKAGGETSAQPDPESHPIFDLCRARVCVSHVPFLAPPMLFFFFD